MTAFLRSSYLIANRQKQYTTKTKTTTTSIASIMKTRNTCWAAAAVACLAPNNGAVHAFSSTTGLRAAPLSTTTASSVLTMPKQQQQYYSSYARASTTTWLSSTPNGNNNDNELTVRNFTDMDGSSRDTTTDSSSSSNNNNQKNTASTIPLGPDDINATALTDPNGAGDQVVTSNPNPTSTSSSSSLIPPLPETLDASGLLSLDPEVVKIVQVPPSNITTTGSTNGGGSSDATDNNNMGISQEEKLERMLQGLPFVSMFRGSANYIANHRGTLAVYHIPGGLLDLPDPTVFRDLMNDIALTWLLGMKIVLVVGCRHQIEKRIPAQDRVRFFGIPVTDEETLRVVKEEAGYVRFEVERQLARALRIQGGTSAGKQKDHVDGNVVSGNFYSAQPFGILDGIDYKFTGFVRKVEVEKIKQLHTTRDICLLSTLGVSPSGEVFNVNSEALAASVAGSLGASKVIYFTEQEMELRHSIHDNKIQNLRFSDARHLLEHHDVEIHKRGFVTVGKTMAEEAAAAAAKTNGDDVDEDADVEVEANGDASSPVADTGTVEGDSPETDMLIKIGWGTMALQQGVKRAHIISPKFGAVLQELYTRDGSGVLLSKDLYEGIRRANVNDVSNIYDLILPLIQKGTLVDRPRAVLEKDVDSYYCFTRDNHIVACGQLKIFEGAQGKRYAELGCLVVNKEYRAAGRGDAMLGYLERLCFLNGANSVFVLSTQTMEWFVERGFDPVTVDELPPSRQATYNSKRASKIYMKEITSSRDLDQSELWWNR